MKKYLVLLLGLLALALTTGCGPSLKEYVAQSNNYTSSITNTTTASVNIEAKKVVHEGGGIFGAIGSAVNTASAVGSIAMNHEQGERLQKIIESEKIATLVSQGFNDGFTGQTHLQMMSADAGTPDLRIKLKVNRYGLWAENIADSIKFYVSANIEIIFTPEMKSIYDRDVVIQREAANVLSEMARAVEVEVEGGVPNRRTMNAIEDAGNLINGAANLTAFFELTDEQIVDIFDYMAYDAGLTIADRLNKDIYR